ncbi:MAG: Alw26I/Eco31I/Esp3I family type II restriction adenine-specific DNA-methyltransferase [Terriglobia bacterium]
MDHVELLRTNGKSESEDNSKGLLARVTGRFYTHEFIANHLIDAVLRAWKPCAETVQVIEPFSGDGRLVILLLEKCATAHPSLKWDITLWDCDQNALNFAQEKIAATAKKYGFKAKIKAASGDTFTRAPEFTGQFDLCITNPPWEVLKPDRRELTGLSAEDAEKYVELLKQHDTVLRSLYPLSSPLKRFSGWGTNLARCGVEASLRLLTPQGVAGIVSPASLLADQMFRNIRKWVLSQHCIHDLAFYAAEARLFENVDHTSITIVAARAPQNGIAPVLSTYGKDLSKKSLMMSPEEWRQLNRGSFIVPLQFGLSVVKMQEKWWHLPKFVDLEKRKETDGLWAGRELDETGHEKFLAESGDYLFMKGRMVKRFGIAELPTRFVSRTGPSIPATVNCHRLVWRDVARPNQKRRMHAAIIPPGIVTGNSLNVAYFRDGNVPRLKALLAVVNSFVFEAQVRSRLATGHISLGSVREVYVPHLADERTTMVLSELVDLAIAGDPQAAKRLEVEVALLYGLNRDDMSELLSSFAKVEPAEANELLSMAEWNRASPSAPPKEVKIPNHYSASLSELDLMIARAVPPGGNWKDIPLSVPSQRLQQIRESYAAGEGSRSTYYGRLHPEAPSYTISTYFGRPGNGCHLHYEGGQHRVLSQREAARLQSFPDSFVFLGNKGSINQQIGNAVPPLLAYQVASRFPKPGQFVDLFSGAGGLALGFIWAGWKPIVANDIEESYLDTYQANIDKKIILGDIREAAVFKALIEACEEQRNPKLPLVVLGGPPCQGFSTAGNRRSMNDERNWLFKQYKKALQKLEPTAFVFENVTGLLNMEGGKVFEIVRRELLKEANSLSVWKLKAEEYGIPQRRTRVILVGTSKPMSLPPPLTQFEAQSTIFGVLPPAVTVRDALSDLPALVPGEDGSTKNYLGEPQHPYQRFMRGLISAGDYVSTLTGEVRQAQTA